MQTIEGGQAPVRFVPIAPLSPRTGPGSPACKQPYIEHRDGMCQHCSCGVWNCSMGPTVGGTMPQRKYTPETPRGMRQLCYYWSRKDPHTEPHPHDSLALFRISTADTRK
eukprot:3222721-Amphidinium_carterae.1